MLQIPIIPRGGSNEEDGVLRLACPLETDLLFGHVRDACDQYPEETRCIENEYDFPDERSDHSMSEIRTSHENTQQDMFFGHIRSAEEEFDNKNWKRRFTGMKQKEEEEVSSIVSSRESPVSIIQFEEDVVETPSRLILQIQPTIEEETTRQINQIMNTHNRASQIFEQEIRNYLQNSNPQKPFGKPILKRLTSADSQGTNSTISSVFTNVSYDNSSIMKLKARKRMLENHLSASLNEVRMNDLSSHQRDCPSILAVSTCS